MFYSGNVLKQADSAGNFRTYEYDSADRQTAVNYFDENGVQEFRTEFAYDPQGNITVMEDYRYENGSKVLYRYTEKQYDGFGRMISEAEADCNGTAPSETDLSAGRITYTYDNDDRLTAVSYPSAFGGISGLTYEYGEYNRLLAIKAEDQVLREYTYGAKGEILSIKDHRNALGGTGYTVKTYEYDRLQRPASITVTDSEKEGTIEAYTYQYDVNSQIIKETRMNLYSAEGTGRIDETWDYAYDNLGRLLQTTVIDAQTGETKTQKAYTYDDAGNRLTETENGQTTVNTYNLLNQMVTGGDTSYSYDANGNLKEESSADLVKQYTYDADNRLDTAVFTEKGQTKVQQQNTYNGEGQRISKTENGITTNYSYQSGSVVYTDGGEKNRSFNIMGDAGNVIASEREDGAYFYNKDMRSSTTAVTDGSGNCKAAYEYTDFGETTVNSDFYNEIAYTGGIWDQSTGLYYLNARYYDPDDGRFLTEDTIRPDAENAATWHLYAYCANNPVNYVDPSGHFVVAIPWIGKAGIVLGGIFLTYYTTTKEFQRAWRRATSGIEKKLSSASRYVKSKAKALSRDIGVSFSKAKKKYKNKTELHHIVVQRDRRAKTARWVLKKVGIKVNDDENLISIKKGLHKRLHRNDYFSMVNSTLQSAYYKKKGSRVSRVKNALNVLKSYISVLNRAAPF